MLVILTAITATWKGSDVLCSRIGTSWSPLAGDVLSVTKKNKTSKWSDVVRTAEFIHQDMDIITHDSSLSIRTIAKQHKAVVFCYQTFGTWGHQVQVVHDEGRVGLFMTAVVGREFSRSSWSPTIYQKNWPPISLDLNPLMEAKHRPHNIKDSLKVVTVNVKAKQTWTTWSENA